MLDRAWLSWAPVPWFSVSAGFAPEVHGPAVFRDLVPTFALVDALEVLATGGRASAPSSGRVAVRTGWREWSMTAEASPFPGPTALPDPASVWFPGRNIPSSFESGGSVYSVQLVGLVATDQSREWARRWPVKVQLRWSGTEADLSAGWYRGPDSETLFLPSLVNPGLTWDLTLSAQRRTVEASWATLELPVGSVLVFAQAKAVRGRGYLEPTFGSSWSLRDEAFRQEAQATNTLEAVGGASWSTSLSGGGVVRLWAEATGRRDTVSASREVPDFSQGGTLGLRWEGLRGALSADLLGGAPWSLDEGWLFVRGTWSWTEGREFWVGFPAFWGAKDTSWGQFRNRVTAQVGVSWSE